MKKTLIIIVVLIIIGFGIYFIASNNNSTATQVVPAVNTASQTTQTSTVTVSSTTITTTNPVPVNVAVSIQNFAFNPATLTVKTGTKVTWTNNDSVSHTVTSDKGSLLSSPTLSPGQSFSFTFVDPGTVNYHCSIHSMMKGKIIVQ